MSSTRHSLDCSCKRRGARIYLWPAVALAIAMLAFALMGTLRAQERTSPQESSLDRAVDAVQASSAMANDAPDSTGADSTLTAATSSGPTRANPIESFFASWRLFHNSYYVGWLVGMMLALVGVVVVARDQVFIGAAVSQASTLGIALALCASGVFPLHHEDSLLPHSATWLCCDSFQVAMAVAFSVLAALITSRADRAKRESHEAITGWIFLISASLSVLVVAHSPHGLEEVNRIHSSSIIGATGADVALFGGFLLLTIGLLSLAGRRLLLFVMDPSMAAAVGMNVGRWATCESIWLGLVVGLSIRTTGMLFTFGSLVLPALVAKNVCREVRPMFVVAPVVALITNAVGFVLANGYDFPPAQMNVAILCVLLLLVWGFRRILAKIGVARRSCSA